MACGWLCARRIENGALELQSTELNFEVDSETKLPQELFRYKSGETNKLIEEFMLLANEAAAVRISKLYSKLSVLRNHKSPKELALQELANLLQCHGITDFNFESGLQLSRSLDRVTKDSDPFFNQLVRSMATRCMEEAQYVCTGMVEPKMLRHYGLGMSRYTHFTSPIRRYADCLVHRFLAASLGLSPLPPSLSTTEVVEEKVKRMNFKHKMAQWADRASQDLHLWLYFQVRGGVEAEGVVMRVQNTGIQVAVEDLGAEGVVEMTSMDWLILTAQQAVHGRPLSEFEDVTIQVFDRVIIRIQADLGGTRRKLLMEFVRLPDRGAMSGGAPAQKEDEETAAAPA